MKPVHISLPILIVIVLALTQPATVNAQSEWQNRIDASVVAEGKNTIPSGPLEVLTYRLERWRDGVPVPKDSDGTLDFQFRLVITTKDHSYKSVAIWIGDDKYPAGGFGRNGYAIHLGRQKLPNNAVLGLSLIEDNSFESRSILPERLMLPDKYAPTEAELAERRPKVSIFRSPEPEGGTVLLIEGNVHCYIGGNTFRVEVGDKRLFWYCRGSDFWASISNNEFDEIPDGAEMVLWRGQDRKTGRRFLGRLDKSKVKVGQLPPGAFLFLPRTENTKTPTPPKR